MPHMFTSFSHRSFFSIVACVFCLCSNSAFAKTNISFVEAMKTAISEFEKKKDKGALTSFEIEPTKSSRVVMTVTPSVGKGQVAHPGYKIIFYDCRADQSSCQSIRFETSRPATSAANVCGEHWTNTFRFGRVRADTTGMLTLDMTQLIFKEIKAEDLQFTLGIWLAILGDFNKLLEPGGKCNPLIKPLAQETPVTTFGN